LSSGSAVVVSPCISKEVRSYQRNQGVQLMNNETYSRLENEARLKSLGVWAVPGGIQRPWDYRRGKKSPNAGAN